MYDASKFNSVVSFLRSITDLFTDGFKMSGFRKIILPFTMLRRLDHGLDHTKYKALKTGQTRKEKGTLSAIKTQLKSQTSHILRMIGCRTR